MVANKSQTIQLLLNEVALTIDHQNIIIKWICYEHVLVSLSYVQ